MTAPLLVVGGAQALAEAADDVRLRGWRLVEGWDGTEQAGDVVRYGAVTEAADVARVVLAMVSGAGVLAETTDPRWAEQLVDDLRRAGRVEHRSPSYGWVVLHPEERRLLDLLGDGLSLGEAAARLHLARRTADRRLSAARQRLGVSSNGAAVAVRRRRLGAIPAVGQV
jgi:DNA-binding CsgD family transcriptional regulator